MTLLEAGRLVSILVADPSSAVSAALQGWSHPVSREALILMDIFDLDHTIANQGKKVKPHPQRPQVEKPTERKGNTAGRSRSEVEAILRAARDGNLGDPPGTLP